MRSYGILSNKYIDKNLMLKFYTFWSDREDNDLQTQGELTEFDSIKIFI